jgi:hypothetical protein
MMGQEREKGVIQPRRLFTDSKKNIKPRGSILKKGV